MTKAYIGDGVYAYFGSHGDLCLQTENGLEITNKIVLEPEVFRNLVRFIQGVNHPYYILNGGDREV